MQAQVLSHTKLPPRRCAGLPHTHKQASTDAGSQTGMLHLHSQSSTNVRAEFDQGPKQSLLTHILNGPQPTTHAYPPPPPGAPG